MEDNALSLYDDRDRTEKMLEATGQGVSGPMLERFTISKDTGMLTSRLGEGKEYEEMEVVVLKAGTQWRFFNQDDPQDSCQSNYLFKFGDKPVGKNLGYNCQQKEMVTVERNGEKETTEEYVCPKRRKGLCKFGFVLMFIDVTNDPANLRPAIFSGGKSNFFDAWRPFEKNAFLQEGRRIPYFGRKVKISIEMTKDDKGREYKVLKFAPGALITDIPQLDAYYQVTEGINKATEKYEVVTHSEGESTYSDLDEFAKEVEGPQVKVINEEVDTDSDLPFQD